MQINFNKKCCTVKNAWYYRDMTYREYYLQAVSTDAAAIQRAREAGVKPPPRTSWGMHRALAMAASLSEPTIGKAAAGEPLSPYSVSQILTALGRLDPKFKSTDADFFRMCSGEIRISAPRKVRSFGGRRGDE
jgi:hypothetical protein